MDQLAVFRVAGSEQILFNEDVVILKKNYTITMIDCNYNLK